MKKQKHNRTSRLRTAALALVSMVALGAPNIAHATTCMYDIVETYISNVVDCRVDQALDNVLCVGAAVSGAFVNGEYDPNGWRNCQAQASDIFAACVTDTTMDFVDNLVTCIEEY